MSVPPRLRNHLCSTIPHLCLYLQQPGRERDVLSIVEGQYVAFLLEKFQKLEIPACLIEAFNTISFLYSLNILKINQRARFLQIYEVR